MKILLFSIILFSFKQLAHAQSCLHIQFIQETGDEHLKVLPLYDFYTDFQNSTYESDHIINAEDSAVVQINEPNVTGTRTITIMDFDEDDLLYMNFRNDSIYSFQHILGEKKFSIVKEEIPQIQWEIKNETDTLMGFKVQKALTTFRGRDYEAWFTGEIPFSGGPRRMHGLPGMILRAKSLDDFVEYYPVKIEMKNENCSLRDPLEIYSAADVITVDEEGRRVEKFIETQQDYRNSRNTGNRTSTIIVDGIEKR